VIRMAAIVGGALVLGVMLITALLWWRQERIVFQPPRGPFPDGGSTRRVDYSASDGQPLFAFVVSETPDPAGVLLAFHGNADLAARLIPWAIEISNRTGWAVLLAEYRGYAGLGGRPTYEGAGLDSRAAYAVARDSLGMPPERIALYGHSLGSAIASELAPEVNPHVLILESPFSSARDMARIIAARPMTVFWGWISRVHWDTEARVRELKVPVHVAHGASDFIIPARMGRQVHAAAAVTGELLIVEGAGHNDVSDTAGDRYWRWIVEALVGEGSGGRR
jgi:fermentation-respiration switch protein FrsA (DUF1100 family)